MARILIVDDSSLSLQRHQNLFKEQGHVVKIAHDGNEAYTLLDQGEVFDLIILDLEMPVEDGIEVLKNIKSQHPNQHVIVVSSDVEETRKKEAIDYGAIDLFLKPLDEEKSASILNRVGLTENP